MFIPTVRSCISEGVHFHSSVMYKCELLLVILTVPESCSVKYIQACFEVTVILQDQSHVFT